MYWQLGFTTFLINSKMCEKNIFVDTRDIEKDYNNLISRLDNVLSTFRGHSSKPINYNDFEAFPLFEWISLDEKVKIQRRKMHFGDYLNFHCTLKKGGRFNEHFHEDIIESTEVIKGKVLDLMTAEMYNEGDVLTYGTNEKHDVIALEDTEIKVLFKKTK